MIKNRLKWIQVIIACFFFMGVTFAQTNHTVTTVGSTAFSPNNLTITVGDTVTWVNAGGTHNVNGTQATFPSNPVSFGGFSPSSGAPEWPFSFVFTVPGTYSFQCDPHSGNMNGTVQVNSAPIMDCSELFISEYIEGSSNNKAVEIYNPTSSPINLAGYTIELLGNGGSFSNTFNLVGTIAAGGTYIFAADQADPAVLALADSAFAFPSVAHFNGDDAIIFTNPFGDTIDIFGIPGMDPGSAWDLNSLNGIIGETRNSTLIRAPFVKKGDTAWSNVENQWISLPIDDFSNLGVHYIDGCSSNIPHYLIAELKGVDVNVEPDSLGVMAQIIGTVLNPDQGFNSSEFAIQDGTAGIWVTGADPIMGYTGAEAGDVVQVFGTVDFNNGVIQFDADSIVELFDTLETLSEEKVATLDEYSEGRYVRLDSVRIINNSQDTFDIGGGGQDYEIVTQGNDTLIMRVDRDYELNFEGNPVPTGLFNVVGVGSQFDGSSPHDENYQIFPSSYADLEILFVTGAAVQFTSANDDVFENAGSYQVMVTIGDTITGGATIDVVNTTNGTAALGNDFTFNDTTLTFSGTSIDTFMLNVGIIDNAVVNPDRTVELALRNITGGVYGLDTLFTLTIINDDYPTYTLGQIRGNDNLGGTTNVGLADSLGVTCRSYGIVNAPDIGGSNLSATIQDATGAITVFEFGSSNPPALVPGDSVEVVGTIGSFSGLSEFTNNIEINVISSGNPLPAPLVVDSLGEFTESRLIRMNNMSFVDASVWTSSVGGSFNIDITNGIDTFVLRVDSDLPISNQATPPSEPFDVIGFGGQFDSSDPFTSGYQIFAIDSTNFIPVVIPVNIPTYSIGDVDGVDGLGAADSAGVYCALEGVVYGENFRAGAGGLEFTLIDSANTSDGIGVFSTSGLGYTVTQGDKIRVVGTINQVLGLTRITADSITVTNAGLTLKTPTVVTGLNESTESDLVTIENVNYISEGAWTNAGAGFNVRFANATDTFTIRIDDDCDYFGTTEPGANANFDFTGIGGQADISSPFTDNYILLPRNTADVVQNSQGPPVADFTFTINQGTVNFTDASTNSPTSWTWSFDDGFSSISQSPTHTYTALGTYNVCLIASNADGSDTVCQNVSITALGLNNAFAANTSIYPNPANDEIYINNDLDEISEVVIYNLIGKEVMRSEENGQLIKLDVSGIESGQYILRIMNNEKVMTTKVIIQE